MEKRYQVFVSSTYEDLQKERLAVIQSLLEFDCIPVGMEFFPAADDAAWEVIKRVIGDCDYYVVIVAGRYGSLSPEGISYTQKEYDYAIEKGVPIMAFLHGAPGKIIAENTEGNEESKKKLEQFRDLCKQRLCKYWTTADELAGAVIKSLNQLKKTKPGVGWVRADRMSDETSSQILRLTQRNQELEEHLKRASTEPPIGTESLSQGDEKLTVRFVCTLRSGGNVKSASGTVDLTWDQIFGVLAPEMMTWTDESTMQHALARLAENAWRGKGQYGIDQLYVDRESVNTIKIQLRSLGLIERGQDSTTWKLTPYGDHVMIRLRAIHK